MGRRKRRRVDPTHEWEQVELLCAWDEQRDYERIRPLVLFGEPIPERAAETRTSERVLYRRVAAFREEGMESLFSSPKAKRRVLPPAIRRKIVDLKAEHPPLNLEEIANICGALFGRRPDGHTVKAVLGESAIPRKLVRRFAPYHEAEDVRESRRAVVTLHGEGWSDKSIAGYLKVDRSTVYRVRKRFEDESDEGLADRPGGRPRGVHKVDLRAMNEVRKMQENPELGAFRVHAALELMGIHLSPRTCGRILALNRRLYGLEKPKAGRGERKEMPFASKKRQEYWTTDVRYLDAIDEQRLGGRAYVISVLENHSRAVLASAVSRNQDLAAFLSVLYAAVERYGSPEALVTDGGSIFRANQAKAIYDALGIRKEEIERGRPWQSYIETTFNIQRRMADWRFARAESWPELVAAHDAWVEDYNAQSHWAHRDRPDGRRSPSEVLGWVAGVRYREEELERAFFSTRFSRVLDSLGYARFRHWRVYGEEGLAGREAALWLHTGSLTLEYRGQPLSRYDVELAAGTGELRAVARPRLYETSHALPHPRLFGLEQTGWLKALRRRGYAPRASRRPSQLQETLFPYGVAWS